MPEVFEVARIHEPPSKPELCRLRWRTVQQMTAYIRLVLAEGRSAEAALRDLETTAGKCLAELEREGR